MKLNLGAGDKPIEGYTNLDRKTGQEVYPLKDVADGACDEIRASHVLEHFPRAEVPGVVAHWVSKLRTGGVLRIAVPDFKKIAKNYLDGAQEPTAGYIMGGQVDANDYHRSVFDDELLRQVMTDAGLADIQPWTSEIQDCAALPISLNLQGIKAADTIKRVQFDMRTMHVIMSIPRLTFSDNNACAFKALMALGCVWHKGTGVYWDQVLSRQIEDSLEAGAEYIMTLDYDTWFQQEHVIALCRLAALVPDAMALVPMQVKREADGMLVGFQGLEGVAGHAEVSFPASSEVVQAKSGHFGLTLFRREVFEKIDRPWFCPRPGPDGRWGEGRVDSDISFWDRMAEKNLKVYMCPKIMIGHYQLVCSFPPALNSGSFETIHRYSSEVEAGNVPAHCIPEIQGCA